MHSAAPHLLHLLACNGVDHLELEWRSKNKRDEKRWIDGRVKLDVRGVPSEESHVMEYVDGSPVRYVHDLVGNAWYRKEKHRLGTWECDYASKEEWRICAANECTTPMDRPPAPGTLDKMMTREKIRKTYFVEPGWRLEFTRVRVRRGGDVDAEDAFETELELDDPSVFFLRPAWSVLEWGEKMLPYGTPPNAP